MGTRKLVEIFFSWYAVTGLLFSGFRHVLALLGLAVPARSRLVINARVRIHPDHSAAIRRRRLSNSRSLSGCCGRRRGGPGGGRRRLGGRWSVGWGIRRSFLPGRGRL